MDMLLLGGSFGLIAGILIMVARSIRAVAESIDRLNATIENERDSDGIGG